MTNKFQMNKLLLFFICIISLNGSSQDEYKKWSARQEVMASVNSPFQGGPSIDSVIGITDVIEIKGIKYVSLEVLYSEYLHWESLHELYYPDHQRGNTNSFDTTEFYENFEREYGQIYGSENVIREEDRRDRWKCSQCRRAYSIKNRYI